MQVARVNACRCAKAALAVLSAGFAALLAGCSPPQAPGADAGAPVDAAGETTSGDGAAEEVDASSDAASGAVDASSDATAAGPDVPPSGDAAAVPCFSLPPLAFSGPADFGAVAIGTTEELPVVVQNCGAVPLEVVGAALLPVGATSAEEFSLVWPAPLAAGWVGPGPISAANPLVVPVNGTAQFVVRYTPADVTPGGQFDKVQVALQFATAGSAAVTVQGTGYAPSGGCPVAVAKVVEGAVVVPQTILHLQGGDSYAPAGLAIAKYQWTAIQPTGSIQPFVPSPAFPNPTFTANAAGIYQFCLEVWDAAGQKSCKPSCVDVAVVPDIALHMELLWQTPGDLNPYDVGPAAGADLDLHFAHPLASSLDLDCDGSGDPWFSNPFDAFWFNPNPAWDGPTTADDPSLDLDDMDGAGPENLNLAAPAGSSADPIAYAIGVHYWNDHGYGKSIATVRLYTAGTLAFEVTQVLQPLDMWYVAKLHWPNTLTGGTAKLLQPCYQAGASCALGKSTMWADKGDPCVTPCYVNKPFIGGIGGAAPAPCPSGPP